MTALIEMSDYTLAPHGLGHGINDFNFKLSNGEVCVIEAQSTEDAYVFLRAIATLIRPVKGSYRFKGKRINLTSYKDMLHCKSQIGYIGPNAALISNLTVRQNILIQRYYFENDLSIDLDDKIQSICNTFGIDSKLDQRPAALNNIETQLAIIIREICKKPNVLLLDRPEIFFGRPRFDILVDIFNEWIKNKHPVVFVTGDRRLFRRYANRNIIIADGILTDGELKLHRDK